MISYTYTVMRHGKESYETVRFAGVGSREDRDDQTVHNVGACFADTDAETRKAMEQHQALSDGSAGGGRAGQQGQDRIPLQHEP